MIYKLKAATKRILTPDRQAAQCRKHRISILCLSTSALQYEVVDIVSIIIIMWFSSHVVCVKCFHRIDVSSLTDVAISSHTTCTW